MRTNIEIDDALMAEAQKASGQATKKQTVEAGASFDDQIATAAGSRRRFWQISLARQPCSEPKGASNPVIVVVSSVWIDFLNGRKAPHVERLRAVPGTDDIIVGDLMFCEVLHDAQML